jgi:hypothetical protein
MTGQTQPLTDSDRTALRPAAYLINLTGSRIDVLGRGRSVVLAPLRRLPVSEEQLCAFDASLLRDSDQVRLERPYVRTVRAPLAVYGVLLGLALLALLVGALNDRASTGLLVAAAVAVAAALWWAGWTLAGVISGRPPSPQESSRWLSEKLSQLFVFVIGFGSALAASLVANGALADGRVQADESDLFRIALQTVFLGLAITFPAFLYYAFDRQRAAALRTRFLFDVFRLDDRFTTVGEIEAKYGGRMKDAFGDAGSRLPSEDRVQAGRRRSPVVVATLVLSLGLVVAFVDVGGPTPDGPLLSLFTPTSAVLPFAFLGAYLFAVLTSLRSYLRGDLLPKAYSQIAARMLVVVTLGSVIGALAQVLTPGDGGPSYSPWLLGLAFLAGLVPNTVLQFIAESTRGVFPLGRGASLGEPQPLTLLQGIDLYDRARLEQEGVTTLGGIVNGDVIDLMMQTRIPTGRLVDWIDQAVLLQLVGPAATEGGDEAQPSSSGRASWQAALHEQGIRTASDLLVARPSQPELDRLVCLVEAEPVMRRVLSWKRHTPLPPRVLDARRRSTFHSPDVSLPVQGRPTPAQASLGLPEPTPPDLSDASAAASR